MSLELVMLSNHFILCHLLLLPSIFSSIKVFSNELALHVKWPKYWSSPSNEHSVLSMISFRIDWFDLLEVQETFESLLLCYWKRVFAMPSAFSWQNFLAFWLKCVYVKLGFPDGCNKDSACNAGDLGLIPELERSPGEENGYSLQYSCLENFKDRGTWQATVHGVAKSQTFLWD